MKPSPVSRTPLRSRKATARRSKLSTRLDPSALPECARSCLQLCHPALSPLHWKDENPAAPHLPSVPSNFSEPESPRVPPMTSRSPCTHAAHLNRTNTLFFSRPRPSLQPAISWTTHQQHPLMLWGSLKQRGITIVVGRMDCGRTTCRAQASGCRPISSSRKVLLLLPLDYPLG